MTFLVTLSVPYLACIASAAVYRHQWFQTQSHVEVAVLAKKMTKERVDITIEEQHLRVVIWDAEGEQEFELDLPLYSKVS